MVQGQIQAEPEGVSAEPRRRHGFDPVVFGVAGAIAVAFVVWGIVDNAGLTTGTGKVLGWVTDYFGWLFVLASCAFVIFSGFLALSKYGHVKLGKDDTEPEFSTFSWVSMMFATGMGIGLMFWGVAEPLTHLNTPPMDMAEPGSPEAAGMAMEYTFFHWGLHPWAMYAVIGLAIAYFAYRRGRGNLISSAFWPLIGKRADGGPGKAIDVLAIFATLFGSATSLGLGALQITGGLDNVFGSGGGSKELAVAVIAFLTLCFVISAVSGIDKGIKWLSNSNAIAAGLLVLFLFIVGPTVFILSTFTESLGGYLTQLPAMSFRTGVYQGEAAAWLNGWTIFYWAWWISWTPFVGMFIARISKGRTIRQFVFYVIAVPSLVSFIWFAILGGAAFNLQFSGVPIADSMENGYESALFATLEQFPLAGITVGLAVFLVAIFYVTGADSASIVMGMLSESGEESPRKPLIIFWGVATGAVAGILLFAGGLGALQTLVIIAATPFLLVLMAMCVALMMALREEPDEVLMSQKMRRVAMAERARLGNGNAAGDPGETVPATAPTPTS